MHGRWERQALAENFRLLERESWRQAGGRWCPRCCYLHRSVVRVAHVHRADYRRCWRVLESLVSKNTRWVLSVCHCLNCEIGLKLAKVWGPLVHYGVEIVLGIVVISHKIWAHVSVQLKIGALMLGAFPAPK